RADDLEILQGTDGRFSRRKRLVEYRDVDAVVDLGPVGDRQRHIEIVVEDCTAQPRHGKGPLMARVTADRRQGRSPCLRAIGSGASGQIAVSSEACPRTWSGGVTGSREDDASKNRAAGQA